MYERSADERQVEIEVVDQTTRSTATRRPRIAREERVPRNERWPVSHTLMFITVISVALWSLIIAAASWLIG